MYAVILLPVFLAIQGFALYWLLRWLSVCGSLFKKKLIRILIGVIYYFCVLAMYIGLLLPHGKIEKYVKLLGYYWYGISVYIFMVLAVALLIRFIMRHLFRNSAWVHSRVAGVLLGLICVGTVVGTTIYGHINAGTIRTTKYEVTVKKDGGALSELNVVLVADFHLGYNIGPKLMQQMAEKVNACNPDIVLIAGDIFDNAIENVEEPDKIVEILKGIESKYGTYAVWGNHDCEEPIVGGFTFPSSEKKMTDIRMDELIEECGIQLMRDESILLENSVYIYGRPDEERPGRDIDERRSEEELMETMDRSKPVIVFEHEPKFLDRSEQAGVDVHLAGHTHDGLLFPLNISCAIMWENSCGLLQKGDMTSIVTSGVGLYGPNMRVGTIPEICDIHISFDGTN